MLHGSNVQRSILLNLSRLHCHLCHVEAGILPDAKRIDFRGVESPRDFLERVGRSPVNRGLFACTISCARMGALDPHKMPACFADHQIESRRCNLFNVRPAVAKWLSRRVHTVREDAPAPQEHRMQFQACPPGVVTTTSTKLGSDTATIS